jgi:hypothetical protein
MVLSLVLSLIHVSLSVVMKDLFHIFLSFNFLTIYKKKTKTKKNIKKLYDNVFHNVFHNNAFLQMSPVIQPV